VKSKEKEWQLKWSNRNHGFHGKCGEKAKKMGEKGKNKGKRKGRVGEQMKAPDVRSSTGGK